MSIEQTFGELVRDHRCKSDLSQRQLAQRMNRQGFSWRQTTITKIELGQRPTPVDEAVYLAAILGFSLDGLIPADVNFACPQCNGTPPSGFTCNECGERGATIGA